MNKLILSAIIIFSAFTMHAQTGTISGTVNDGALNDVLPFANILVQGTQKGTTTDFDGKYSLNVDPGTYTLEFSFVGYATKEISEVVVTAGKTTLINVTLSGASLEEVVIKTTARKNTEQSVLNLQKQSVKLLDGLSLESIKRTGASNVAAAVKNVPGVSVQGGKFVFVRGLGDRYTKSILNGVDVPGLDPDRNTLQLDVFPSSILENVIVAKSGTADQPADFTGGVVDIVTKAIPSRKEIAVSIGASYNPDFHFNDQYIANENSNTDFIGFDNGLRDNPISINQPINPPQQSPQTVQDLTGAFEPTLGVQNQDSGSNFNFSIAGGNSYDIGDNKLGFLAALSYRNETTFYEDYVDGQLFRKNPDSSVNDLDVDRTQQGSRGSNDVLISAMGGLSFKTEYSKYRFNILHIQSGESGATNATRLSRIGTSNTTIRDILTYTQRGLTNALLSGTHTNEDASWTIDWTVSPTLSIVRDKDFRVTPFQVLSEDGETTFDINASESGLPIRFWRDLDEVNIASKLDIERKHNLLERGAKFKFGGAYTYKQRDFTQERFSFDFRNIPSGALTDGNSDAILGDFAYDASDDSGFFVRRDSDEEFDVFDSSANVAALYASEELRPASWFTAIVGLRFENYTLNFTGANQSGVRFEDERIIDAQDFFPSANLIFDLDEDANQKVRASYYRTTARPSFKEASLVQLLNPVEGITEIGNTDLEPSYINNMDLRFEVYGQDDKFLGLGDFFALSGFYKTFQDPIEKIFFLSDPSQVTWQNLNDARVIGGEIELRKTLDFIGLTNFSLNTNFSLIDSNESFSEDEKASRQAVLRDGEELPDGRQLQGQSPFLLNAGIAYGNEDAGWKAGLFYNVQGRTLQIVGARETPDVFTLPFHDLKFNLSKSFGEEDNQSVTLKVGNLLDDDRESVFESFETEDEVFSRWSPGQTFSLSYSYKF